MKWLVVIAFALILGSLASAMVYLIRDRGRTRNVVRALGFRVGFSILLFPADPVRELDGLDPKHRGADSRRRLIA
jgi:hypothetical protein